jgi:aryl-alcohol dehydrogenase-like predicted oxidoreductase
VLNWSPAAILEAAEAASASGRPGSCAAQLPYSLATPDVVEAVDMSSALDAAGTSVVASFVLAGGALTDKYSSAGGEGRLAGRLDEPRAQKALRIAEELRGLAQGLDTTPCRLAIAFALINPRVATVLFGATRPEQVAENVGALELLARLEQSELETLRTLASGKD